METSFQTLLLENVDVNVILIGYLQMVVYVINVLSNVLPVQRLLIVLQELVLVLQVLITCHPLDVLFAILVIVSMVLISLIVLDVIALQIGVELVEDVTNAFGTVMVAVVLYPLATNVSVVDHGMETIVKTVIVIVAFMEH